MKSCAGRDQSRRTGFRWIKAVAPLQLLKQSRGQMEAPSFDHPGSDCCSPVEVKAFGAATTRPDGKVSVNATPVRPNPLLGLLIVKVSEVEPLTAMDAAPNDLASVGAVAGFTVRDAVAVLPPPADVTVTELLFTPAVIPVTLSEIVQNPT